VSRVLAARGNAPGLVHVISAMESCPSYKPWLDKSNGHTFLRAAPAADAQTAATVAAASHAYAALSPADRQRLDAINTMLDEQTRSHLKSDGGDLAMTLEEAGHSSTIQ